MIELTHIKTTQQPCTGPHVWPLRVTATSLDDTSPKIFVFFREKDTYDEDQFWGIATVPELSSLPEDAPTDGGMFFRTDTLTFHTRSEQERDTLIAELDTQVGLLNEDLKVLTYLGEEVYAGDMIVLTKQSIENKEIEGQHVWPLTITAESEDVSLSSKIFVFHASMGDDMYVGDTFEAVASVQQMQELPEDAPGLDVNGEAVPYYRVATFTFYARTPAEADQLWDAIIEDVDDLTRNWSVEQDTTATHTSTGD